MKAAYGALGVVVLISAASPPATADTLFLRSGKALKIEALSCDSKTCLVTLLGGGVEVRAVDVLRVEPNEDVDPEPAATATGIADSTVPRTTEQIVADAALKYALPRSLLRAVARAESAFNPAAVSPRGAQGVMQLMPGTARSLGVQDAFDPGENIDAGARLLRQLLEKYQGRVAEALAAYNAGEGAVARHKGVPPYGETRGYIRRVVKDFEKGEKPSASPATEKRK